MQDRKKYFKQIDEQAKRLMSNRVYAEGLKVLLAKDDIESLTLAHLKVDRYLVENPNQPGFDIFTTEGIDFINSGGYSNKYDEQRAKRRLDKWLPIMSLAFVGLAAFMSVLTYRLTTAQTQSEQKTGQLQEQVTQQGRLLQIQQTQIDSLLIITARRDSVPK